jgi:uncharacterized RDD family membrane protein YckC
LAFVSGRALEQDTDPMKYHVARDGKPIGIFLEYEVRDGLKSGELRPTDLYWREGMEDWLPLSSAPDLVTATDPNPYAPPASDPQTSVEVTADGRPALATLGQRLQAFLMDMSLASMCLLSMAHGEQMIKASGTPDALSSSLLVFGLLGALALIVWTVILLCTRGQTIGKRWMNIRIANYADDANPGFVKAVLLRNLVSGLPTVIPILGLVYFVTDIAFIFRPDRRCIHDLIAGTHVVQGSLPKR